MRPTNSFVFALLAGFFVLLAAPAAQAAPFTSFHGVFWNSTVSSTPISTAADYPTDANVDKIEHQKTAGSFDVSALNFNTKNLSSKFTYNDFLTSNGATVANSTGTTAKFVTGSDKHGMYGTIFKFTGEGYFNPANSISVTSDDGFSFYVLSSTGSVLYSYTAHASPQSAEKATFSTTGFAAGNYSFELNYGAVNGVPEVLQVNGLQAAVPEPSTVLLLGVCLIGFAIVSRKKPQRV
ncbi:MAG: PEP-CTERM sorting domain-containing protein [Syntrophobacteraceae bacterium]